ncbi:MAG: prolyl oligopeptidase family serine peptidase [Balneolales bacterium]|nr:prolyl oligopeptidase family serine peptidase [Balneolales bacterium]
MKSISLYSQRSLFLSLLFATVFSTTLYGQDVFTFEDVMRFENLEHPVISNDGNWIAYSVWPERGDGESRIQHVRNAERFHIVERGERTQIAPGARFAGSIVRPPFLEAENASSNNRPRNGLALINLENSEQTDFSEVQRFDFTADGKWLIIRHIRPKSLDDAAKVNSNIAAPVTLVSLPSGYTKTIDFVSEIAPDSTGRHLVYAISDSLTSNNGLYYMDLSAGENINPTPIVTADLSYFGNITWDDTRKRIAFTATTLDSTRKFAEQDAVLVQWQTPTRTHPSPQPDTLLRPGDIPSEYRLRMRNNLTWTRDGNRLFYGLQSNEMVQLDETETPKDTLTAENLYDLDHILKGVGSDVWHWNDPQIKTHERQTWNRRKNHLFTGVFHLGQRRAVQLATKEVPDVSPSHSPNIGIGRSDLPYQQLRTWDGTYHDYYLVDLNSGEARKIREKAQFGGQLSPQGRHYVYFNKDHWHSYNTASGNTINITESIEVPFADEDNDRPMASRGYGIAGWVGNEEAVLIYDKFDIWQFNLNTGAALKITDGRDDHRIFRIRDLAEDRITFARNEELLLTMYNDDRKNYGFYRARVGRSGATRLLEEDAKFSFVAKAADSDAILFTKERYDVYPNLWVASNSNFRNTTQITNLHDDLHERWAWGTKAELIEWLDMDGRRTQGVVFYPGDYEPGKQYPVMVYYYERFSQRLHDFNHPVTNHRPNTAQYTSDGYIVFYPDVWFDVPLPGYSATKSLVPGVQKLIEMGIADPNAIGLHGHSWSGYLTAHVITQTDIFAAAVAGAPVSNMTSAYSGIRWGTGLARLFQYEQQQSRLGVSMYENYLPYIENSPVFFAERINTPLLIQFGDEDDAVPWYQGIELYLAMRRLGKDSVFLQYHGEPHHLRVFANRLDYAIKMKEYFDHYLKGTPAPEWMTDGVPYRGR